MTLSRTTVLKPGAEAVRRYVPGGKYGMRKTPALVVAAAVSTSVATLMAFTIAVATTALLESVTVPLKVPRSPCANRTDVTAKRTQKLTRTFIFTPLSNRQDRVNNSLAL